MSRLKVYSGGTGRLQLDSNEQVVDEHSELAREDFQSGVLLHLNEKTGALRCRFLARRRSPEQFVAFFRTTGDSDVIADFKRTLETNVERAGWRIERGDEWTVQVFDALGEASPGEPNEPIIRRILQEHDRADLGVPTERAAVRLLEYCRKVRDRPTIAVCNARRPDHLDDTEVVINPSREYDTIVPIGQTETRVRKEKVEDAYSEFQSALTDLDDALNRGIAEEEHRRQLLARTLRQSGIEGDKWTLVAGESSQLERGMEQVKSVLGIDQNGDGNDEVQVEDIVGKSILSRLSAAASNLKAWTDQGEFRRAIEQLLERYEIEIEDR